MHALLPAWEELRSQQLCCLCRMYLFPRFLDPERAEHVVQMAKSRLAPSALALRKGDKESEKS